MKVRPNRNKIRTVALAGVILLIATCTQATIRLPRLISDGLVLQRDQPLHIWGWADAGEQVIIEFMDKTYSTVARQSHWDVMLPPLLAGGPYKMIVSGNNRIVLNDILIGDVWICSGQSNMEFNVARAKDKYAREVGQSTNNQIRQFLVKRTWNFQEQGDVEAGEWKAASPHNVLDFTAVGYFFAKALYEKYHVPIGLINATVGGTPVEAWTSAAGLKEFPGQIKQLTPYLDQQKVKEVLERNRQLSANWYAQLKADSGLIEGKATWAGIGIDLSSWKPLNIPGGWQGQGIRNAAGITWIRKEIDIPAAMADKPAVLDLGHITDSDSTYFNGLKIGATGSKHYPRKYIIPRNLMKAGKNEIAIRICNIAGKGELYAGKTYQLKNEGGTISLEGSWIYRRGMEVVPFAANQLVNLGSYPSVLYNSMIAPLVSCTIKGVIWYQGEANTREAYEYRRLFPALISDWRQHWKQGNFPFLFVQLANLGKNSPEPAESSWAELREAQLMALSVPNTGMAVTHDIGEWNDIHPLNKEDVGKRLALAAENIAYDDHNVVYSGPIFKSMKISGNRAMLSFDQKGGGLVAANGLPLNGFAIAGPDKKFKWASAKIEGDRVVVWNDTVPTPSAVRYGWANNPDGANLYNKEGLPASSFRTDNGRTPSGTN